MESPVAPPSPLKQRSESGSDVGISGNGDQPDRNEQSNSWYVSIQSAVRTEEYRQLFHLPPDEVLLQDFNCAFHENILLQGHMYLFVHHICFYSNIFGFETKKTISFNEVTCVRKAKTAAIFPTAIEIFARGKRHFFGSFFSRDEAYRLIVDGWSQYRNGSKVAIDRQDSKSGSSTLVIVEKGCRQRVNDLQSLDRNKDVNISEDCTLQYNGEDDNRSSTRFSEAEEDGEEAEPVISAECFSSGKPLTLKLEDVDAPKIPGHYTMVAESKFPLQVEEFFNIFFSDDAAEFIELFHRKCGDKAFRCTSWFEHEQFGHVRDLAFQHPIKFYLGARYGNCQELQKFHLYKDRKSMMHLLGIVSVLRTLRQRRRLAIELWGFIFLKTVLLLLHVQGLWDVERDGEKGNDSCILRVYIHVAFSKKTILKGKIEQSTIAECNGVSSIWIETAQERLKKRKVAKLEGSNSDVNTTKNDAQLERHLKTEAPSEGLHNMSKLTEESVSQDFNTQVPILLQGGFSGTTLFRESLVTLHSYLKSQSHFPLILLTASVLVLLMVQVCASRNDKYILFFQQLKYVSSFAILTFLLLYICSMC
ncbi:protein VASCULAR ASSOCIATED DEATH 1, chloroplastic-like isoform X2 [Macadamia integrifolia]|uniref:protein VASCULAR ASSOCIATED DEATH 1, chloroplastic-like isoform X2 n=1 Tax=Macadamia integrifolia TaxID=60698 RepID=UPI001C4F1455|nr:protein VASCULAR ASSOCIATED DEATH 1, chloroplastic-like isoform X2 [Macadamia integrifolia]